MFCLPFLFNLRTRFGIEVIAAGIACGKCLVPMQANANHIGHRIIRLAHDGEDVPVSGPVASAQSPQQVNRMRRDSGVGPFSYFVAQLYSDLIRFALSIFLI